MLQFVAGAAIAAAVIAASNSVKFKRGANKARTKIKEGARMARCYIDEFNDRVKERAKRGEKGGESGGEK